MTRRGLWPMGLALATLACIACSSPGSKAPAAGSGALATPSAEPSPVVVTPDPTPSPSPTPPPTLKPTKASPRTAPASASATTVISPEHRIAQAVFQAINQDRAAVGLPALRWDDRPGRSARQHDLAMAAANQMSHQLPGEPDLGIRQQQQGVRWSWIGECIGENSDMSTNGALVLHRSMMAEPYPPPPGEDNHHSIILTPTATILGVDIVLDPYRHRLWLTEDFARA